MTQPSDDDFAWPVGGPVADADPLLALAPWMLEAALAPEPAGGAISAPQQGWLRLAYASVADATAAAGRHRVEEAAARLRLQELRGEDAALAARERRLRSEAGAAPWWRIRRRATVREQLAATRADRGEVCARMAEWEAEEHDCAARARNAELVGRLLAEAERATARARAVRVGEWAVGQLAGVMTRTALGGRASSRDSAPRWSPAAMISRGDKRGMPALPPVTYERWGLEARQ